MLSAAGAFIWDAAIAAAVPGLDLVFRVPRANYVTVGSETQAHWERSFSSEPAATFDLVQPVSARFMPFRSGCQRCSVPMAKRMSSCATSASGRRRSRARTAISTT